MMIGVIRLKFFIDRLIQQIEQKQSAVCVGLDPHLGRLPGHLKTKYQVESAETGQEKASRLAEAIRDFNRQIITMVAKSAVMVKPQLAFYEQLGPAGLEALTDTIKAARQSGLLVLLDGKRNDIGSSARGYAAAYLDPDSLSGIGGADALTINPYLGREGVEPFLADSSRGAFALVRTSNPGAEEIQNIRLKNGTPFYLKMGKLMESWGENLRGEAGYSNLGAVVGATHPVELKELRQELPHTFFLIPGFGAQGAGAEEVVAGFDEKGLGGLVNAARSIIFAYQRKPYSEEYSEQDFALAAGEAARDMRDSINQALETARQRDRRL